MNAARRLISTINLSHSDWLDVRRTGLGGSDVAAICGLSRYKSPMEVYLDKLGEIPPIEDNPKMKAGRMLEPLIADWFGEETGMKVMKQNSIFQHSEHKFMLANIDRWLPGQNSGLEIKNTAEYCRSDWEGQQAPTEYVLQCNHYMAITGAERWFIAVLIGGWDFQWRVVERDEAMIRDITTIEHEFWHKHVLAQIPPAFSHQDSDYLKEKYRDSIAESCIDLPEETYPIMVSLYEARDLLKKAKVLKETASNQLKGIMGEKEKAFWQGELKFTWKKNKKGVRPFLVVGGEEE